MKFHHGRPPGKMILVTIWKNSLLASQEKILLTPMAQKQCDATYWRTVLENHPGLRVKDLILLDPSKIKMVSYSAMRRTSLADEESIPKDLLIPVTIGDTRRTFEGEYIAEVFLAVKTLKAGKAAGCDDIRPEVLKVMNRGVLWLNCVSNCLAFWKGTER